MFLKELRVFNEVINWFTPVTDTVEVLILGGGGGGGYGGCPGLSMYNGQAADIEEKSNVQHHYRH
jgi:hypothetical protein